GGERNLADLGERAPVERQLDAQTDPVHLLPVRPNPTQDAVPLTLKALGKAAAIAAASVLTIELALRAAATVAGERVERRRDDAALLANADVAVYGDSTPFGLGANTTFAAELALLTDLKVVNRSRPGINSSQTYLVLRDDLEHYSPRIVLV